MIILFLLIFNIFMLFMSALVWESLFLTIIWGMGTIIQMIILYWDIRIRMAMNELVRTIENVEVKVYG